MIVAALLKRRRRAERPDAPDLPAWVHNPPSDREIGDLVGLPAWTVAIEDAWDWILWRVAK